MQVIVNDLAVNYTRTGEGPVFVLLHGWGDSLETFSKLLPELEKRFTVIRIDLAGFGGSQAPTSAWGLADYAKQLRDILQKIAVSPQDITVLMGHSNGGAIAVTAISEHYLQPKRLVLLASSGVRNVHSQQKNAVQAVTKVGKLFTFALPASKRSKLRRAYYEKIGSDLLVAPHMEKTFARIVKEDILKRAETITVPTLLIYGELDTDTPPAYGMALQQAIAGSDIRVIQGAGHFLHHTHPDQVIDYMREFLS